MDFKELNQKHDKVMDLAAQALLARQRGDESKAMPLFHEAFNLEREVAHEIASTDLEPSRSVIHRSAANLALIAVNIVKLKNSSGQHSLAIRLIASLPNYEIC